MAVMESVAMLRGVVEIAMVRDGGVGGEVGQGWERMLPTRLKRGYASVTPPFILGGPGRWHCRVPWLADKAVDLPSSILCDRR